MKVNLGGFFLFRSRAAYLCSQSSSVYLPPHTVVVAQLVRAPDCGSGGRGFETHLPPHRKPRSDAGFFYARKSVAVLVCDDRHTLGIEVAKNRLLPGRRHHFAPRFAVRLARHFGNNEGPFIL